MAPSSKKIYCGQLMSRRISLFSLVSLLLLFVLGCGGGRKQVSVAPEELKPQEPVVTFGTVAEIASQPTQLTFDEANNGLGSYHPNGDQITFQSDRDGHWQIYMLDPASGVEEQLIVSDANDENPMWMPDSSGLLFTSDRNHPGEEYARDIFFYDPVAAETITLTDEVADDWYPVPIDPDSYYFLSERTSPPSESPYNVPNSIYKGMLDGTPATLVAGLDINPSAPADLEDGTVLVRSNDGRIAKLSVDGSLAYMTGHDLSCGTVSYSHTRKIAALNARDKETYHLYLFDLSNGIIQRVETGDGEVRYPQFSPDGNKILYSQEIDGNFQLFQLELAQ